MNEPGRTTVCRVCGTAFATQGDGFGEVCLGCLLGAALTGGDASEGAAAVEAMPPRPGGLEAHGTRFAHYEITTHADGAFVELGRGAMGVTYRAVDTVLHHQVALKVVAPPVAGNAQARARFLREAQAAASLRHPHIASVFFFGERPADRQLFYAMELIEGETLQARVARAGGLPADTVLEIGTQVAEALAAAEARGLTHRDLKPANVMLSQGEKVDAKVIDFGLARTILGEADGATRQTRAGEFVGTPAFASPEHFNVWQDTDARSDFYALGATLWYALTGHGPFAGRTSEEVRDRQLHDALPVEQLRAARVPPPVANLLRALLSPDPGNRPQTARELAAALSRCRAQTAVAKHQPRGRTLAWTALAVAGLLVILSWAGLLDKGWNRSFPAPNTVPEKSIAVLPFDNFSEDKDSAFFADGVQDEVLTDLAKVADLKVISRASVMQYKKAAAGNLREIGKDLGVAYVVEGSVRRAGGKIRVTARLIDARTDIQHWAEKYDRPLNDVFAIQSEIAQAIAGQLQAAISPREHATMEEAPTRDLQAYALYVRARGLWNNFDIDTRDWCDQMARLLTEATRRDPNFARAFVLLVEVESIRYRVVETTPAQEAVVRDLVETVTRLRPGSADAHRAAGIYAFMNFDLPRAHDELSQVVRLSPNDASAFAWLGETERAQGQWEDALFHCRKAAELDPADALGPLDYVLTLEGLHRYPEEVAELDREIAARPQDAALAMQAQLRKVNILLDWKADTRAARSALSLIAPSYDPLGKVTSTRLFCDCAERDFAAAERDLAACPLDAIFDCPRVYYEGCIARYRGDKPTADKAFTAARPWFEANVRGRHNEAVNLMNLAMVDAALDRTQDALEEGKRAFAVNPGNPDPRLTVKPAVMLCWAGERDEAIRLLQSLCAKPDGPTYGYLKLHPDWDSLRGDTRFEALVASLAPKP